MQTTPNYGLKKPDANDTVNIADLNANADTLDSALTPTADPTQAPTGNGPGKLVQWVGWLANRIKVITGKTNWYDAPDITLATLAAHKTRHATGGADALAPADIGAAAQADFAAHLAEKVHIGSNAACRANSTLAQSVPSATWTVLTFDNELLDNDNMFDIANNSRIIINTPGKYLIGGYVQFANNATGIRGVKIAVKGLTAREILKSATNTNDGIEVLHFSSLNPGDYIELSAYQTSGSALNVVYKDIFAVRVG